MPAGMQEQLLQGVMQKVGLNSEQAQGLLNNLMPMLLQFLHLGAPAPGSSGGGNPLMSAFLDSDHDGDVDLGDAFKFAGRFLNSPNK